MLLVVPVLCHWCQGTSITEYQGLIVSHVTCVGGCWVSVMSHVLDYSYVLLHVLDYSYVLLVSCHITVTCWSRLRE